MNISPTGQAIIKAFENCHESIGGGRFKPYLDPASVLTIGWGHTNHHSPKFDSSTIWTQNQCDDALVRDLSIFDRHVARNAGRPLLQHQHDALVSWAYNTGGPDYASVWTYVRNGDDAEAVRRLQLWNKATIKGEKVTLNGLVRRRQAEGELYLGQVTRALKTARSNTGPIARKVPQPKPNLKKEVGGVITSGAGVVAGALEGSTVANVLVAIGVVVVAVLVLLIVRKQKQRG